MIIEEAPLKLLAAVAGLGLPILLAATLPAGLGWAGAVLALRWLRHRVLRRGARMVQVLPPPEATLDQAHAFWTHVMGLLKPRWQRVIWQPHLAWELRASAAGIRIGIWVPGLIPPGTVERAIAAAWPGATTKTRPAAAALPRGGPLLGGWMRMARADEYPLRVKFAEDPLRALLGAVGELGEGQQVVVRVCARPATAPRVAKARAAAARLRGAHAQTAGALLLDAAAPHAPAAKAWPDVGDNIRQILTKAQSPRLACQVSYFLAASRHTPQALEALRGRAHGVASSFSAFTSGTNHLRRGRMWRPALWTTERYLARGYLLSVPELAAIAHIPTDTHVPGLARAGARPAAPTPAILSGGPHARILGDADAGTRRPLALGTAEARHHTHIVGKTGSGKSTLIAHQVLQDAEAGRAALVIDPRGDLITDILARVPDHAVGRVVLFDPDDAAAPPRLNLLQGSGSDPEFCADAVVGIFHRIYEQWWGPRTDDILRAATLTLTRAQNPAYTLGDIPKILADDDARTRVLGRFASDEALRDFWRWYDDLTPGARAAATGPVLNKLRTALLRPWVRAVIASGPSTIDLGDLFDNAGIVLLRLPKGRLGEDTAALIGSFALAATWQVITRRIRTPEHHRRDMGAYVDECHNFLNLPGSLADMLAEARGYRLALTLAHQELGQLPGELRSALAANARSKIYFTVSPDDARHLQAHTLPSLAAYDLSHLGVYQAAARLLAPAGGEQPAATLCTRPLPAPIPGRARAVRDAARRHGAHAHPVTTSDGRPGTTPEEGKE